MDLFPTKTYFVPQEKPSFVIKDISMGTGYSLYSMEKCLLKGNLLDNKLVLPELPAGSYGLEIGRLSTAFEVSNQPFKHPRYGFISEFSKEASITSYGDFFLQMHLNCAQYYDWMYKHEDYIAPSNPFVDPMGQEKSQKVVKEKLDYGQSLGILPFAYGAIYGATNAYALKHPQERFYSLYGQPLTFIDRFSIMNFAKGSSWRERLLLNYEKAIGFGFAGIHMDTYGSPKEAWDYRGQHVAFEKEFPMLIDEASQRVKKSGGVLTFNNVGAWPLETTCHCQSAFDYAEIWDPLEDYNDLLNLIREHHTLAKEKPLVLAAYLHPFYEQDQRYALASAEILDAVIASAGAFHLMYGDEGKALRTGYYPDNAILSSASLVALRKIANFSVRYGDILFDPELVDISLSHLGGPNAEVVFSSQKVSPKAIPGGVLSIAREKDDFRVWNFINLAQQIDDKWNQLKNTCFPINIGTISLPRRFTDERFFWADVDSPRLEVLPFEETKGVISLSIPPFRLWGMLVSKRG